MDKIEAGAPENVASTAAARSRIPRKRSTDKRYRNIDAKVLLLPPTKRSSSNAFRYLGTACKVLGPLGGKSGEEEKRRRRFEGTPSSIEGSQAKAERLLKPQGCHIGEMCPM